MQQSNNPSEKRQIHDEEIDLRDILKSAATGLRRMFYGFMNMLLGIRSATISNYKLMVGIVALCLTVGLLQKNLSKPYYESSMLMRSAYLNGGVQNSLFNKLNQLCEEENHQQLAKILGLSVFEAKMIKGISVEQVLSGQESLDFEVLKNSLGEKLNKEGEVNHIIEKIQEESGSTYKIKVAVYDPSILENLETPLINYIRSNEFIKKRIEINRTNLLAKRSQLEAEIKKLDTLGNMIQQGMLASAKEPFNNPTQIILGEREITSPLDIIKEGDRKFNEMLEIDKDLFIQTDFEVIDGLVSFNKPSGTPTLWVIVYSFLVSVAISYLLIFLIGLNKLLNKLEDKNDKIIRMSQTSNELKNTGT